MRYTVVIEQASDSLAAYVPDLPGCVATGNTREELLVTIREAIEFHIESLRDHGEPIPDPLDRWDTLWASAEQDQRPGRSQTDPPQH